MRLCNYTLSPTRIYSWPCRCSTRTRTTRAPISPRRRSPSSRRTSDSAASCSRSSCIAADSDGRHQVHFGAKRLRAAMRAGLHEVPVVVRDLPADRYAQVAENQKRHGLTPLELARFIRAQVDAGDSNATIARQLGMNLTAVAHHLSLLELPPELDDALKAGRCTSPRTLHELSKLHADRPDQVRALLAGEGDITRASVSAIRSAADEPVPNEPAVSQLIAQASAACDRLERALSRIKPTDASPIAAPAFIALRGRVETITQRWLQGSDRQTPPQAER